MDTSDADRVRLTTEEAASLLGVKKDTLYAYVSRGLVNSHRVGRESRFDREEIVRLARSRRRTGSSEFGAGTNVSDLRNGVILYRGRSAVSLADSSTFEDVAELLWTGTTAGGDAVWDPDPYFAAVARRCLATLPEDVVVSDRLKVALSAVSAVDPVGSSYYAPEVIGSAKRILASVVEALPEQSDAGLDEEAAGPDRTPSLCSRLWRRLSPVRPRPADLRLLEASLILLADHGLASSTQAARTAAMSGANLYGALSCAMGVGSSAIHGGSPLVMEDVIMRIEQGDFALRALVEGALQQGGFPGFGHPVHHDGDPRAAHMFTRFEEVLADRTAYQRAEKLVKIVTDRGAPPPNVYLAMAVLARSYSMLPGSAEAIYLVGRAAGWVASAIEAYEVRSGDRRSRDDQAARRSG